MQISFPMLMDSGCSGSQSISIELCVSREDKVKLNAKIKELEETLKKSTETIEAKTQDLVKKEKMVADVSVYSFQLA